MHICSINTQLGYTTFKIQLISFLGQKIKTDLYMEYQQLPLNMKRESRANSWKDFNADCSMNQTSMKPFPTALFRCNYSNILPDRNLLR